MKTVCLIGKPNVGKSTIFNRLIKEKKAIILDTPGITRDRIYGTVNYQDKSFHLIDTGGISLDEDNTSLDILAQATLAIDEADLILFIIDGNTELDASDYYIRDLLFKSKKEVWLVVNKIDNEKRSLTIYNYYELGFKKIYSLSAEHNIGFDALLQDITKDLKDEEIINDNYIKFCFIGRPNVGKSSLVNALLKEERVIVSDIPGTTRDAIDTVLKYQDKEYLVIDTAGLRKKGKIYENIERYSYLRSMKAIDRSDVCVLVIDAGEGIIEHDKHILSYALESGKGIVLATNKWDLIDNPNENIKKWNLLLKEEFKFVPYLKTIFVSAKKNKRLTDLIKEVDVAYQNNRKEISTSVLNKIIEEAYALHAAPSYKGKRLKIYFVKQSGVRPPKITFEVNNKNLVHFSYERYLENKIRENIDLTGTPIILQFKNKNE